MPIPVAIALGIGLAYVAWDWWDYMRKCSRYRPPLTDYRLEERHTKGSR